MEGYGDSRVTPGGFGGRGSGLRARARDSRAKGLLLPIFDRFRVWAGSRAGFWARLFYPVCGGASG